MTDDNKKNLIRLLCLFGALAIVFLSVVTITVTTKYLWASVPVVLAALVTAGFVAWDGFFKNDFDIDK